MPVALGTSSTETDTNTSKVVSSLASGNIHLIHIIHEVLSFIYCQIELDDAYVGLNVYS